MNGIVFFSDISLLVYRNTTDFCVILYSATLMHLLISSNSFFGWVLGFSIYQLSSVQSICHLWLFATPWTAANQASLSITNSRSLFKLMSIESVMPFSHLILCCPLLLLPPIPPTIRVFSMSQLFAWGGRSIGVSASASVLPMNTQDWSFRMDWLDLLAVLSRVFSYTTVQKHQFFSA